MIKTAKKSKKSSRRKPTIQEIEQRNYRSEIRAIFRNVGFEKVLGVSDQEFTFCGVTSDFDDVFIYENIIVFVEYTLTKADKIGDHLKPKKIVYDKIINSKIDFLVFFENKFETFKTSRGDFYDHEQCKVIILYCSKNTVNQKYKDIIANIKYFDYQIIKYFKSVTEAVKLSTRFEFFSFLGLKHDEIGSKVIANPVSSDTYKGSILPHSYSNFDKGYKVVSFYIDPDSLLQRSYVLRKDGWRDEVGLYQRMIVKNKITTIRRYLVKEKRVFINNIIVTLPSSTKLIDQSSNTINPINLTKTEPVTIQIPKGFNVIGLIDGQHRVFAYHEGGESDNEIMKLRVKQNLLVTGIIYPESITAKEKTKFEANLFLEINANQTNAKSDLKQAIELLLRPYSSESIGKGVINRLNNIGPLEDFFERHFYDNHKIKTTSIVSYGLKSIVKLSGLDSFYSLWKDERKTELKLENNDELLSD